jgi:hypothetical protein
MYYYAKKAGSPLIDMEEFISFLEKYAKRISVEKPEWTKWASDTRTKVSIEADQLAGEGKLVFDSINSKAKVHFCLYYAELVKEAYKNAENESDMRFPD